MSTTLFECKTHIVPCSHIRHYARSTSQCQEDELYLHVRQYILRNATPTKGDVTIIAAHATGFQKELYEPLWDELLLYTQRTGAFQIRAIWIADMFNQGVSGLLNKSKLGNEPSWFDSARDYLALVNHFRRDMTRPLVGFGHSAGATVMLDLALMHPRLFVSVVAVEPIAMETAQEATFRGVYSLAFKADRWPSREDAVDSVKRNPFYKTWDPRVVELYIKHAWEPDDRATSASGGVRTITSKDQELLTFARAAYPSDRQQRLDSFVPDPLRHPDMPLQRNKAEAAYRPEPFITFALLPHLRPSCHYVFGGRTHMKSCQDQGRLKKRHATGVGIGGSGGWTAGRVRDSVVAKGSHFLPFEVPADLATTHMGPWLSAELERWQREEATEDGVAPSKRAEVPEDWHYWMEHAYGSKAKHGVKL